MSACECSATKSRCMRGGKCSCKDNKRNCTNACGCSVQNCSRREKSFDNTRQTLRCETDALLISNLKEQVEITKRELEDSMKLRRSDLRGYVDSLRREVDQVKDLRVQMFRDGDSNRASTSINPLQVIIDKTQAEVSLSGYQNDKWVNGLKKLSQLYRLPCQGRRFDDTSDMEAFVQELEAKFYEEQAEKNKVHNELVDAKGKIRVFCRLRPPTTASESLCGVSISDDNQKLTIGNKYFKCDRVFSDKATQDEVFSEVLPLVSSVLDGYNVCVFAYGQTGSGKTYTMDGVAGKRGLTCKTLEELFKITNRRMDTHTSNISVSILDVYNNDVRDLLSANPSESKLKLQADGQNNVHIKGLIEKDVASVEEALNYLEIGRKYRATASNNVNVNSSRSHCFLCISVKTKELISGESTLSKLWLVDLGGSQSVSETQAEGDRRMEGGMISESLLALRRAFSALKEKTYVAYRTCNLTRLFQIPLGGKSKVAMFVHISQSVTNLSETTIALEFAEEAQLLELGPSKKNTCKTISSPQTRQETTRMMAPQTVMKPNQTQTQNKRKGREDLSLFSKNKKTKK